VSRRCQLSLTANQIGGRDPSSSTMFSLNELTSTTQRLSISSAWALGQPLSDFVG
jgi:hypothetical protein